MTIWYSRFDIQNKNGFPIWKAGRADPHRCRGRGQFQCFHGKLEGGQKISSSTTPTRVHHHLKKVSSSDCNTHNRTKCDRSPQQSGRAAGVERVQSALKKIQFVKRRESRGLQLSNISLVVVLFNSTRHCTHSPCS